MRLNQLQEKLRSNFSEARKVEMEGVKNELPKIVCKKKKHEELCHAVRYRQWYEFGEKNNKYFYNLEKVNHKKNPKPR